MHRFIVLFTTIASIITSSGCAGPIVSGEVIRTKNYAVVYDTTPKHRGEIHIMGYWRSPVWMEKIALDGQPLFRLEDDGSLTPVEHAKTGEILYDVWVSRLGDHNIAAQVYNLEGDSRGDHLGPISVSFHVGPENRDWGTSPGHWWRVDLSPP